MAKVTELIIAECLRVFDHATGTVIRQGEVVGFSESLRNGRAAHGDLNASGSLDHGLIGSPSKGEDGTLETCRMLVSILNEPLAQWILPVALSDSLAHIDCRAESIDAQQPPLDIQVVRAMTDPEFWAQMAIHRKGERTEDVKIGADYLHAAIVLKAARIPSPSRSGIVLALNAIDAPALGFDAVVASFVLTYGEWARQQGFAEIWVVGPNRQLTHQLA
jgi:hypothetical protein